ncbi:glycosyl transferase family protein [Vibrio diazotrophicus]|uniref:glycosyl transferase family protein n=1 Tax=Vibrio diazotrophicus TaxID=685 RepID=UPI0005A984D5|nr:glycosyl transferase family protein [Vibrio diazotrophicus]
MSIIKECIRTVGRGDRGRKPLTFDQAFQVMDEYLNGECDDDQMAMLLMLIRVQNETNDEIAGFVKAFQSRVPNLGADIDWPCYAGKRATAGKPWHLLAAKILADNGFKVLLHGYNDKPASREHAEDYLPALGIPMASNTEHAQLLLQTGSIAYLPLNAFAPQAELMISWKNRYGLRTPINTVVRALNPGGGKIGIRGSFHPGFQQLHAEVEHVIGKTSHSVISFKGVSGESEYNPKVSQTVWLSQPSGVESFYWPEQYVSEIETVANCPMNTPQEDLQMMANTVVSTMAAVLFAQSHDREKAYETAYMFWKAHVLNH